MTMNQTKTLLISQKSRKEHIADIFFRMGMLCEMIASFSGYVEMGDKTKYLIFFGMACLSLKILLSLNIKRDGLLLMVMGLYGVACYYFQGSALVLRIILILMASRDKDAKKVVKMLLIGSLIIAAAVMLLSVLGISGNLYETGRFRGYEEETRYCFGFLHPNSFAAVAFRIIGMFFFVYYDKMRYGSIIIASAIALPFMYLSKSYTGLACSILVIILAAIASFLKKDIWSRLLYVGSNIVIIILLIFSYGVMFFYDGKLEEIDGNYVAAGFWEPINQRFFHGRLSLARHVYEEFGMTLFGIKSDGVITEIGYVNTFISQGIIFMIIYVAMVFYLLYRFYKLNNKMGMILILTVSLYLFMESFIPYANKNLIILMGMGYILPVTNNEQHLQKK